IGITPVSRASRIGAAAVTGHRGRTTVGTTVRHSVVEGGEGGSGNSRPHPSPGRRPIVAATIAARAVPTPHAANRAPNRGAIPEAPRTRARVSPSCVAANPESSRRADAPGRGRKRPGALASGPQRPSPFPTEDSIVVSRTLSRWWLLAAVPGVLAAQTPASIERAVHGILPADVKR